jgi:transposase
VFLRFCLAAFLDDVTKGRQNMFARLKDWRRISMRYDRCAHTFFSAICIAAAVIFWLGQ